MGEGEPWGPWRRVNLGALDRHTADPEGRGWAWLIRVCTWKRTKEAGWEERPAGTHLLPQALIQPAPSEGHTWLQVWGTFLSYQFED